MSKAFTETKTLSAMVNEMVVDVLSKSVIVLVAIVSVALFAQI